MHHRTHYKVFNNDYLLHIFRFLCLYIYKILLLEIDHYVTINIQL